MKEKDWERGSDWREEEGLGEVDLIGVQEDSIRISGSSLKGADWGKKSAAMRSSWSNLLLNLKSVTLRALWNQKLLLSANRGGLTGKPFVQPALLEAQGSIFIIYSSVESKKSWRKNYPWEEIARYSVQLPTLRAYVSSASRPDFRVKCSQIKH